MTIKADDKDIGINAELVYSIIDGTSNLDLHINSSTGEIITVNNLDREIKDIYLLQISITDSGARSLTSFYNVTVIVGDINDNHPQFGQLFYSKQTAYNKVGSIIGTMTASDSDSGVNGNVIFSFKDDSEDFCISSSGMYSVSGCMFLMSF